MLKRLIVLVFAAVASASAQQDRGRPIILLVHGRGMLDRDTALTRQLWYDGLASGIASFTRESPLRESDVRVVWYADVLDPRSNAGCSYSAGDLRAKRDAKSDSDIKGFAQLAGGLLNVLSSFVDDKEATTQLRGFAADASFLSDARKRCAAEDRLEQAMTRAKSEGRPIVLVAHSLGALVAYDYLSSRSDTNLVRTLITIGSPVGSRDLRRLLIGGDSAETVTRPAAVREWINIRNENDPFAATISAGRDILTTAPIDEKDPHEMVGYLRATATAREILDAWRGTSAR
jgi:pimeloyl-ACP methyl ester carboxylesterase